MRHYIDLGLNKIFSYYYEMGHRSPSFEFFCLTLGVYGPPPYQLLITPRNDLCYVSTAGFRTSASVKHETQGIWMWLIQHPMHINKKLAILDTEGLGDAQKVIITTSYYLKSNLSVNT